VLLSSLEGAAPVVARIVGASHEFTPLPGVYQDVPDIVLNIKSLDIRHDGTGPGTLVLDMKGPGQAKASDFKGDPFLHVLNGGLLIAEVGQGSKLHVEITVERGKGYVTAEDWHDLGRGKEIGDILLDSWFGPVRKVNFDVESARVGDRTDYDRLSLEIHTDGSIGPREAMDSACDILLKHFEMILGGRSISSPGASEDSGDEDSEDFSRLSLKETALSPRLVNTLAACEIETLGQLASRTTAELLSLKNLGPSSLKILEELLVQYGLGLKES
jgi:DNA-directed RNA polymerase subunit alpha